MKKLTLLIITTSYPIADNGSEAAGSFVQDLAKFLSKNHNIKIVAPGTNNAIEHKNENLTIYRYTAPNSALSNLKVWNPIHLIKILLILREGHKATNLALSDNATSHILALWALPSGLWAYIHSKKYKINYSIWTLGSDIWSLSKIPIVNKILAHVLFKAKTRFSDGVKLAKDTETIAKKKSIFLPSTRNSSTLKHTELRKLAPFKLVFIGRWHHNKGIDLLLLALEYLTKKDWGMIESIHIYGGGPMQKLVEASVLDLQSKGHPVESFGFITKEEAEKIIIANDYILIPSRIESIPLIFSDALKLGKPVIATPVGDLPDLIEMGAGFISQTADAESYANSIKTAINAPFLDESIIESIAKKFDLTEIADTILMHAQDENSHA